MLSRFMRVRRRKTILNKKNTGKPVTTVLLLIVSLLFFAAAMTVLSPCGPKEDGTWMNCHYAGQAIRILALLSIAAAAASNGLNLSPRQRRVPDALLLVFGILAALLPGTVIHLCMMPQMRCRAIMRPGAVVFGILLAAAALADLLAGEHLHAGKKPL